MKRIFSAIIAILAFTGAYAQGDYQMNIITKSGKAIAINGEDIVSVTFAEKPVVLNVEAGADLSEVLAEVAGSKSVTLKLAAGGEYTVSEPVVTDCDLVIAGVKGSNAKVTLAEGACFSPNNNISLSNVDIDAAASNKAVITLSATPNKEKVGGSSNYFIIDKIEIVNSNIADAEQIINDNKVQYCVGDLMVDNCVVSLNASGSKPAFDLHNNGFAANLTVKNSTFYNKGDDQNYFVQYNNSGRNDRAGYESNSVNYENNTFYNIAKAGQWGNYSGIAGRSTSIWVMKNNIFVDCGNGQVCRRYLGGRSNQKTATFENNTYWFNGQVENYTGYDNSETALTTDPALVDPANGDFTPTGADQVAKKTGDPRWF